MIKNQKHLFSLRPDIHYFNNAAKGPLLKKSEQAGINALIRDRNPSDINPKDFFTTSAEVRELFSKLVACRPSEVAIIPSVSYGMSSVLNNIEAIKGQHALCIEYEFPSDYFAIERWCRSNEAELKTIKVDHSVKQIGKIWNDEILKNIDEKTAVVILSSVHWMHGLRFDLERIGQKCKSVGAKFIVDGTQSVGAMEMDVHKFNISALICASYKWLFGPYSLGLAYMGPEFNDGKPIEESWMNRTNAHDFSNLTNYESHYTPDAGRYNVGESSHFILMPILAESLKQIHEWTPKRIQNYCEELIQPLLHYLKSLGVELEDKNYFSNHLFGLKLPASINIELLKENLVKEKIYVSVRGSSLRVSVNVFNTSEDMNKLIAVIESTRLSKSK